MRSRGKAVEERAAPAPEGTPRRSWSTSHARKASKEAADKRGRREKGERASQGSGNAGKSRRALKMMMSTQREGAAAAGASTRLR
jgi:hypothetical protein